MDLCELEASLVSLYRVPGQLELHSETLSLRERGREREV